MINKHSHEQSEKGEGVEVVTNEECEDPEHGKGRFTEKRVYLNRLVFQNPRNFPQYCRNNFLWKRNECFFFMTVDISRYC